ncbi:M20 family metallopeptidase [Brucella intermedia]|uniref:M20 family metallopeptidase n=1 Tax=Brucella intermedia TaxID=94625 RepID=UPI00224B71AE|nr:M20 family metallopeptidase [Brucella intermedia]
MRSSKQDALTSADEFLSSGAFEQDLRRRVSYRTVSQDKASHSQLDRYLREVVEPELLELGFVCRVMRNPVSGQPDFLFAERIEGRSLPTLLTYAHGDVVAGMEGQWSDGLDPWTVTNRDECWYGRGTADNKGQHAINLAALRCVIEARDGVLGYNLKLLFEMGEECSSPGLREFCRTYKDILKADLFLASDGPRLNLAQPTLYLGSRGSVLMELSCKVRDQALHSGNWGGIVKNPATILANAIGSLVDGCGRLLVRDLVPSEIPASVRAALAELDVSEATMGRPMDKGWGEPGLSAAERLLGWNTLEVLTLQAGNADKPVNAIPPWARAHCQLRFVVGTDWQAVVPKLRTHLDNNGFGDVEVRLVRGGPATRLDPASHWVQWASRSVEDVLGMKPAINPNIGGTVPNDAFSDILGLPTIWVPHSYPGCRQHGPDEHLPHQIAREGLKMMVSLFWDFAEAG